MALPRPLYALVVGQELRLSTNGKPFWQTMLKTRVGVIKCMTWDAEANPAESPRYMHVGDLVEVDDHKDQLADRGNIVVAQGLFHCITKDDLPPEDECILEIKKVSKEEMAEAWKLIKDASLWEDKEHYRFTMAVLSSLDQEKLNTCPSGKRQHDALSGGLISHTYRVLDTCLTLLSSKMSSKLINKDVLLCAAICHDLGKVETYRINDAGLAEMLASELYSGHFSESNFIVKYVFATGKYKISRQFLDETLHCISAHHGSREHGSTNEVMSVEAAVLSAADHVASRSSKVEQFIDEATKSGQKIELGDLIDIHRESYFCTLGIKEYMDKQ